MRHIIIILSFFISCNSNLSTRLYNSSEDVTGGFYDFSLELKKDGELKLNIRTFNQVSQSDTGEVWQSNNKTLSGKWFKDKKSIKYIFDKPKPYIYSLFFNNGFINVNESVLIFSPNIDTAFIYGIPCALQLTP